MKTKTEAAKQKLPTPPASEWPRIYNWWWLGVFESGETASLTKFLANFADMAEKLFQEEDAIESSSGPTGLFEKAMPNMSKVKESISDQISFRAPGASFGILKKKQELSALLYELSKRINGSYEFELAWIELSPACKNKLEARWPDGSFRS